MKFPIVLFLRGGSSPQIENLLIIPSFDKIIYARWNALRLSFLRVTLETCVFHFVLSI